MTKPNPSKIIRMHELGFSTYKIVKNLKTSKSYVEGVLKNWMED